MQTGRLIPGLASGSSNSAPFSPPANRPWPLLFSNSRSRRESGHDTGGTKVILVPWAVSRSRHDIMATQQLWTASYLNGKMPPLRFDFWDLWPQQLLAGLAILLAAALLSLVLFPAGHGSFAIHNPATAFRSRRLFLAIRMWLPALIGVVTGLFCITPPQPRHSAYPWQPGTRFNMPQISPLSSVLLC